MADEPIVFTVRYTKEHCLATAWRYWQRRLGYRYALELAIGAGLLVLATQGPYRWLEVALMVAVGVFAVLGAAIFFIHWLRALATASQVLDPPQSTWTLTEESDRAEEQPGRERHRLAVPPRRVALRRPLDPRLGQGRLQHHPDRAVAARRARDDRAPREGRRAPW